MARESRSVPDSDHVYGSELPDPITLLGPNSYTLHRLHHASPEHLDITSRRTFIGPIPEGWLKSHRRDWYRHHLHLGSSRRTLSFSAAAESYHQNISDNNESSPGKASAPPPGRLADNTLPTSSGTVKARHDATLSGQNDRKNIGATTNNAVGNGNLSPGLEGLNSASNEEDAASADARMTSSGKPKSQKKTQPKYARYNSDGSFVTAEESLHRSKTYKSRSEHAVPDALPNRPSDEPSIPWTEENIHSQADSTTALVRDKTQGSSSKPDQTPNRLSNEQHQGNAGKDDTSVVTNGNPSQSKPSQQSSEGFAPPTGLVRFNLPADDPRNDETLKFRIAQHRQRHPIKRLWGMNTPKGQIIRTEKMLVRVDVTAHQLSADFDEKDCPKIEARVLDKWREFMVVCRAPSTENGHYSIQLYKSRVIPATASEHVRKRPTYEIILDNKKVKINIFSPLDKTVVLWEPEKGRTRIYILRPRSAAVSMQWYTFLRNLLGHSRSSLLQIDVPDLAVSLRLDHPFQNLETSETLAQAAEGNEDAMTKTVAEEHAVANRLVAGCIKMLEKSPEWANVIDEWALPFAERHQSNLTSPTDTHEQDENDRPNGHTVTRQDDVDSDMPKWSYMMSQKAHSPIGLAWKRYDRLEWVAGENERNMYGTIGMEKSHELELRPKIHYPTSVLVEQGQTMTEPPALEGFLIRLTSHKGTHQKLQRLYHKRLYFSTHDNLLVFNRPAYADPPPPPNLSQQIDGKVPTATEIAQKIPLVYSITPYAIKNSQIEWLTDGREMLPASVRQHDETAFFEAERKTNVLLRCDGFIDLLNVIQVRNVQRGEAPVDEEIDQGSDVDFSAEVDDTTHEDGEASSMDDDRTFELKLKNGLVIRLQAYNKFTKVEWIRRLRDLIRYWTHRASADLAILKSVRKQNLDALNIDERLEAFVGQFAHKWEVNQSFASPELYHMCGICCCRTIAHSGILYRKPRMHTTFRRSHVVLVHGHMLIFNDTLRTRSGNIVANIHNERMTAIDLSECYVYSGLITSNDLLFSGGAGYDISQPGKGGGLPLMFDDGWTTQDEETSLTFVLWSGKSKSWFRSEQASNTDDGIRRKVKVVSQLGKEGKSLVFKARSRFERERWVQAISIETERLAQKEDVRIVGKG